MEGIELRHSSSNLKFSFLLRVREKYSEEIDWPVLKKVTYAYNFPVSVP